jgi:hypothetical protein
VVSINGCATDGGGRLSPPSATRSGGVPILVVWWDLREELRGGPGSRGSSGGDGPLAKATISPFLLQDDSTSEMTGDGWSRCGKTFDFVVRLDTCQCHVVTFVT